MIGGFCRGLAGRGCLSRSPTRFKPLSRVAKRNSERFDTLQSLLSSAISVAAFIVATIATLTLFFNADTLLWVIGAAFIHDELNTIRVETGAHKPELKDGE